MDKKVGIVLGLGLAAGVTAFALANSKSGGVDEGGGLEIKMYDADTGLELPRVTGIATGALSAYSLKPGQSAQVSVKVTNQTLEGSTPAPAFLRLDVYSVSADPIAFGSRREDELFAAGQNITFNFMYTAPNTPGVSGKIFAAVFALVDGVAKETLATAEQPVVIGYNIVYKATVEFV